MSVNNIIYVKKNCIWNPATCSYQHGKYLASIMDDPAITCDEVIEETVPTNFNKKKATCRTQNLYILRIYCYLIKYRARQNHLLPFHFRNNKLIKIIYIKNINQQ